MTPARWFAAYLLAVLGAGLVHDARALAAGLLLALWLAGPRRWPLLRRSLLAVLAFNLAVSSGLLLQALLQGRPLVPLAEPLLVMNLRVLLLVLLGFAFVARVNVLQALAFAPTLQFMATLAAGQAQVFARLVRAHGLAFRSRTAGNGGLRARAQHGAATAGHLLDQAVAGAQASAMAVRARGGFDD
nr:ABC transporter permease [Variovorax boronicumulans]